MNTIAYFIHQARHQLISVLGLDQTEAHLEANLLLQQSLDVSRAWVMTHDQDLLNVTQQDKFVKYLKRRLGGEPIAYVLGVREFYGLQFKVSPATLIPRPDTETLVEAALEKIPLNLSWHILDLGTGAGPLALSIATYRPQCEIFAVDASCNALALAKENASHLNLTNVRLIESDWFSGLQDQKFDVIVSNPPYIAQDDEHLQQGDLRFEPISALASGPDGLDDIRKIIQDAPEHLNLNGWLMLEHGYDQASAVSDLLRLRGFTQIGHAKDISGTLRVTFGAI